MTANAHIDLMRVETVQDETTGERSLVAHQTASFIGERTTVGVTTFWEATAANVSLECTVRVRARSYHGEQYLVIDNRDVFEIGSIARSKTPNEISLNCRKVQDAEAEEAIKDALELI